MRKKILKRKTNRFFDPVQTALSPEEYLLQYLSQSPEILLSKSADTLLKEAEEVFKKIKQINSALHHITKDQLKAVHVKALAALNIAAEKYESEKKVIEAGCVYQLIVSQTSRHSAPVEQPYDAPSFK